MAKAADSTARRSRGAARATPGPPPNLQVAALCYRRTAKGSLRVLLITSRDTGRWVIPKGWPMRNRSEAEAAAREAFEEAGIIGGGSEGPSIGMYGYPKITRNGRQIPCVVRVYPLAVREMVWHYPEIGQRRTKWFKPSQAARKVREPELARIIREFDPDKLPDEGG